MQGTLATRKNWVDHINWTSGINQKQSSGGVQNVKNFAKFTEKYLSPATLLKKRVWYRYIPVNFAKFSRTSFFI